MSGLSHTPGKRAKGKTFRGFESRLLRQYLKKSNWRSNQKAQVRDALGLFIEVYPGQYHPRFI